MTEWGVAQVLIAITGFFLAIAGALKKYVAEPIHETNATLSEVDKKLAVTNTQLKNIQKSDENQNKRLDDHNNKLNNHETRIVIIEEKVK